MAKKPAPPTRKPLAKPKHKKPAKKAVKTPARKPARTAVRKAAPKKPANPAPRKPAAKGKPAKSTAHPKAAAKKPDAKGKIPKPIAKGRPAAKAPVKPAKVAAKPVKPAKVPAPAVKAPKGAAKPAKLVVGKVVAVATAAAGKGAKGAAATTLPAPAPGRKPTAGEIAAKIAGKRAEDAANKKGRNGRHAEIAARVLTPADVEARKRRLKSLIVLGKERGFLTFAEINDHLPDDVLDAEQIEGIISMIGDMGIQVYDEAPDAETLLMSDAAPTAPAEDVEEAAEAAVSTLDSEFGRTTDPVRMYMREMGSVELLTREGEIEIAKRIEEGLKHMIMAISACPMTVTQILELADRIAKD